MGRKGGGWARTALASGPTWSSRCSHDAEGKLRGFGKVTRDLTERKQAEENARRLLQEGLGIGLTLVKRLVEMHGGSVEARRAGSGKGSEFTIRLPLGGVSLAGASGCATLRTARPFTAKTV